MDPSCDRLNEEATRALALSQEEASAAPTATLAQSSCCWDLSAIAPLPVAGRWTSWALPSPGHALSSSPLSGLVTASRRARSAHASRQDGDRAGGGWGATGGTAYVGLEPIYW